MFDFSIKISFDFKIFSSVIWKVFKLKREFSWQAEWNTNFNKTFYCFPAFWLTIFVWVSSKWFMLFSVGTWTAEQKISYFCKFKHTYLCLMLTWERSMMRTYSVFPHNSHMNIRKDKLPSNDCTVSCNWLDVKEIMQVW